MGKESVLVTFCYHPQTVGIALKRDGLVRFSFSIASLSWWGRYVPAMADETAKRVAGSSQG